MTNKDKIIFTAGMVMLFAFLFVIAFSDKGAVDLYQLHLKKVRIQRSGVALQQENRALYDNIQRLKYDGEFIENIARTELGMVGKDEMVYQFKKKKQGDETD
ncbi:MAG: septum formation initiator family protein [Deltaproteobacteria bacterium]|nr:septum formation initiator family protein [Deltaproteobacteria bacterium]